MELLSPAGNVEKLYYAYAYGADAAYIGLKRFSLRVKADNFYEDEYKKVIELKNQFPGKKLHCALNIAFHNNDIDNFIRDIDYFKQYPIDAFIVQDLGIVPLIQKNFPDADLHLSTQASCINREAVKMYKSLGFKRVVLGREASLKEIREIKDAVPDIELEAFVHGAMCIAYSGRCLMSALLTGRSAQSGFCSHTCRWDFDLKSAKKIAESGELVLEEHSRRGEYFPVYEGDDFTAILSSKDIRMIEHLKDMKDAGLDSLKIEGRMKSTYYVALVTRAYRKALDALEGKISNEEASPFIAELENVSHRESTTGFYYSRADADKTTQGASDSAYDLSATIGAELSEDKKNSVFAHAAATKNTIDDELDKMHPKAREARERDLEKNPERRIVPLEEKKCWHMYEYEPLNMVDYESEVEFISPDVVSTRAEKGKWLLVDPENGTVRNWVCNGHPCVLYTEYELQKGTLLRTKDNGYIEGKVRDTGR
ncbi:MAG: U32 family peptidase [Treponema sp.]|uniref:peptidase U32 family protein n=1 Tax=Treponema sp. TaxID=166 RepID=UPI00298E15EF|nr:U32 family peptidase [Treponema sp.]MBR5932580.1 U32 family peptidase [Treponema sp.]